MSVSWTESSVCRCPTHALGRTVSTWPSLEARLVALVHGRDRRLVAGVGARRGWSPEVMASCVRRASLLRRRGMSHGRQGLVHEREFGVGERDAGGRLS